MRLGEKETDKHNLYYSMGAIFPDGDISVISVFKFLAICSKSLDSWQLFKLFLFSPWQYQRQLAKNGILLPKLFWPTVRKNWSSDPEIRDWWPRICKILEITWTIYSNSERSEQFLVRECFFNLLLEVFQINKLEQLEF